MVGQCANSPCNAAFRSLHKGKLFVVAAHEFRDTRNQPKLLYVWLCEVCSRTMTVGIRDGEVRIQPIGARGGASVAAGVA